MICSPFAVKKGGERGPESGAQRAHSLRPGSAVLDPPVLADDPTCSDTESAMEVDHVVHRQQRLRLIWNSQDRPQPSVLHRDVRTASCLVGGLARRVGFVPSGAPLPRAIRQQRWSSLNVPLMWASAGHEFSSLVLDSSITEAHSVR